MIEAQTYKLYTRELELKAILEITQAINSNLPEEALYKIYHFTLRSNLNITRLALYVAEEEWKCKVCFGTIFNFKDLPLPEHQIQTKEIIPVQHTNLPGVFEEFSIIIPVFHRDKPLAYALVNLPEIQERDTAFIQTLTNIITVAVENKKMARRQLAQEALNRELEIAKNVQTQLFPKQLPNLSHLQVKADYFPNQVVGGDYYDFIQIDASRFLFCIADASGKGMSAALLMSNFQAALRILIRQTTDLKQIIHELNHLLYCNTNGERFITFFVAIYDGSRKTLNYINAGHNPPAFCDRHGNVRFLDKGSPILGVLNPLPFLEETIFENLSQFLIFAYTDGLIEANNPHEEEFGSEKVMDFINTNHLLPLEELHRRLMDDLNQFCEGRPYPDDVTLLSCRILND